MTLIVTVLVIALAFEYINGFHDTANSIATVVSTKVLTPRQAVVLAACTNLFGALLGTAVAKTITGGLVDSGVVAISSNIIVCALLGAIGWNLITWWHGLPSSSSHALIGGLCGAALAAAHNRWNVIIWSQPSAMHWYLGKGLLWKVIVPMFFSPLLGFVCGFFLMALLYVTLRRQRPSHVNKFFGVAQMFSAGAMGVMHGTNDAQKTMGIIALALLSATKAGTLDHLPGWLEFLRAPCPRRGRIWKSRFGSKSFARWSWPRARLWAAGASSRLWGTRWSSCIRSTALRRRPARRRSSGWRPCWGFRYRPRTI